MMKERQRWRCEEDALVRSYVRQYGPREWHLISDRMNAPSFNRDAKSCLERWKNYLKPGIKKGSLTEEEQLLVVRLQAKHGNKWKKIAAQVPGRTAKRLGKWWEVFKEKQQRERERESSSCSNSNSNSNDLQQRMRRRSRINASAIEPSKYDRILESFAEKLVGHQSVLPMPIIMPPMHWLKNWGTSTSTSTLPAVPPVNVPEIGVCFGELEEGFRAWGEQRKEAAWRVKRVELQLESEKASRAREKVEEVEVTVRALREEEALALERIDEEYNQQVAALRRDAEAKEQKLVEQWGAKHARMRMLVHHQHQHQHQLTAAASSSCYQQQISQGCCSNSGGPCVDLTLSSPPVAAAAAATTTTPPLLASEIGECYRELHQGFQAWGEERKEVVWRLKRVELQLEAEKASRRREKVEEVEAKIRAVRDDEALVLERIDADYKEQAVALRRDAEAKENRLAEQWAAKHAMMGRLVEQLGCHQWVPAAAAAAAEEEMNGQRRSI